MGSNPAIPVGTGSERGWVGKYPPRRRQTPLRHKLWLQSAPLYTKPSLLILRSVFNSFAAKRTRSTRACIPQPPVIVKSQPWHLGCFMAIHSTEEEMSLRRVAMVGEIMTKVPTTSTTGLHPIGLLCLDGIGESPCLSAAA